MAPTAVSSTFLKRTWTSIMVLIGSISRDLIRITAIFVARNGRQFLTQLMTREARNFQFDFLKPQHSNFTYFTKLVEQYTKVILYFFTFKLFEHKVVFAEDINCHFQARNDMQKAAGEKPTDKWLISPLTGERIPSDKLEEHVRFVNFFCNILLILLSDAFLVKIFVNDEDQQIHEIHRQHGFLPDPSKERIGAQPLPPPRSASGSPDGAPPSKKLRTEEDLETEQEWLEK
uniref:SURP motif domain-containing protein n=1 Tax=Heterorhabditis bacteriophora TaxID=37862 RepID=A0A1I7XF47_HETBA